MDVERIEQNDGPAIVASVAGDCRTVAGRETLQKRAHAVALTGPSLTDLKHDEIVAPVKNDLVAVSFLGHAPSDDFDVAYRRSNPDAAVDPRLDIERLH